MNVLFIGFGNTGRNIADKINSKNTNIFYIDKLKNNKYKLININDISKYNFDYCIITLSKFNSVDRSKLFVKIKNTYLLREKEYKKNITEIKTIIPYLKKIKSKIIVVTNPVDKIVTYLTKKLNNQIVGFGITLDSKRYSKELNKTINCIGLHGKAIPLINLKNINEYNKIQSKLDYKILKQMIDNGFDYNLISKEFYKWFKKLNSKNKTIIYLSKYLTQEVYNIKNISISLPYYTKDGLIIKLKKIHLNKIEQLILNKQIKYI